MQFNLLTLALLVAATTALPTATPQEPTADLEARTIPVPDDGKWHEGKYEGPGTPYDNGK
ncbi:Similar to hypothetical protein VDAG_00621 [Verticillium dahliae VdLs.17]; acc. no. EGY13939, partial [Pyronema omphalodes CBS 100304]